MPRIFVCLLVANALLLVATGAFGVVATRVSVERHILLAVFTLLMSCLVQVVAFTYLTVTGKMIAQAVHLAGLDHAILSQVKRLKRAVTLCLPLVFLPMVLVAATGASLWRGGAESGLHYLAAGGVLGAHLWAWWREYAVILANADLLRRVLEQYSARGRSSGPLSALPATGRKRG